MAHADGSITIDRSPKDVFAFLMDGKNNLLWRPTVTDVARVPGSPDGVGAAYKQGLKGPGGRRIDGDYTVVELEPNKRIKFQVTAGPARPSGEYVLESQGKSGTRLSFTLDYKPGGLAVLMDSIITRTMKSEVALLENLKAYLESQSS
jgi:uncharacterized protein YndB with AHSA1/START domain